MIKDSKGITLISLIITVLIIGILGSTAIYYGNENIKSSNFQHMEVQIENIQLKVNELYEEYKSKGTINVDNQEIPLENLGQAISDTAKRDELLQIVEDRGTYVGNSEDYRYYNVDDIEKIFNIDEMLDEFIINIKERVAIIYDGYRYDGKTYYTLNDFDGNVYNVNYKGFHYIVKDERLNSTITISNISYPGDFSTYNLSYGKVTDTLENITWTTVKNINYTNNKIYDIKIEEAGIYAVKLEINGESIQYSHIEVSPRKSMANRPDLKEGMIPVIWDRGTLSWVKADVNNENNSWYNYELEENMWANVVTVSEKGTYSRAFYENAEAGTKILMNDINAMFVWIPRYAYKTIYYKDNTYKVESSTTTQYYINEIIYSKGTEDSNINKIDKPTLFENDNTLTGFWVAKFEASNINDSINIKPNQNSLKNINFNSAKTKCKEMTAQNNIYGLKAEEAEVDILLDNAWDAISKLSKFSNRVIRNNSYYEGTDENGNIITRTGMTGEENIESEISSETSMEKQTENTGIITLKGSSNTEYTYYEYWTDQGNEASTTGNIYGVYDMVGGCKEYTYSTGSTGNVTSKLRGGDYSQYIDITASSQTVSNIEKVSFRVVIF